MVRKFKAVVNELQVLRAQGGDEQAFRELVETWSPYLLRFCQSRTDNADIALEVVQAVWLQVVKGLRRLHDPARFPAWLFTIAARACADQVNGQVHRRTLAAHYRDLSVSAPSEEVQATAPAILDLKGAIRALSAEQRRLLDLYYHYGYSVEEIAEQLNIPSGTVKSRLHGLREKLRRAHEGESDE